jgi:hypothetical protein
MIFLLLNLIIAEVSAYLVFSFYNNSPIATVISYPIQLSLFILPFLGLFFKKPFSFKIYAFMLFFSLGGILSDSELFYAILDTTYYFGFKEISQYIYNVFSSFRLSSINHLLTITWLYVTSEVLEYIGGELNRLSGSMKQKYSFFAFIAAILTTSTIYLIYPLLIPLLHFEKGVPTIFAGIAGISLFLASAYLIAKQG